MSQPPFPVLLLTTTGARTGRASTVPLGYAIDDGRVFVVASKAGAPRHPAWFHNLRANPSVVVEIGDASHQAHAVVLQGAERDRLYAKVSDGTSPYEHRPCLSRGHSRRRSSASLNDRRTAGCA